MTTPANTSTSNTDMSPGEARPTTDMMSGSPSEAKPSEQLAAQLSPQVPTLKAKLSTQLARFLNPHTPALARLSVIMTGTEPEQLVELLSDTPTMTLIFDEVRALQLQHRGNPEFASMCKHLGVVIRGLDAVTATA